MTRSFWKSGEPYIWLSGCMLSVTVLCVLGLFGLILFNGLSFFWPRDVVSFELRDGSRVLGEVVGREKIPDSDLHRIKVKQGNRDVYGRDFRWIDEANILRQTHVSDVVVLERKEWGNFYGTLSELRNGSVVTARGSNDLWSPVQIALGKARALSQQIKDLKHDDIGVLNYEIEKLRLELKSAGGDRARLDAALQRKLGEYQELEAQLEDLRSRFTSSLVVEVAGGQVKTIGMDQIVDIYRPNQMSIVEKLGFYVGRIWEFVSGEPRESNTEGGVFPAIFGTVLMVILMSLVATPLGVIAAIYLREYAKQGRFVSMIRIGVNNLAGVPSIVFGVFGVGFFIYFVGGGIDNFFFSDRLPAPTFGTGGILWASLTLALLTIPTVIVATEEGLASIPKSLREASYALGATKFETTWRVVLPALTPSILTGAMLATARAAGEVAPLMITGVVKLAPSLAVDGFWPYLHLDRKFMHLGFHIYDVGFQSPNVEAARPMVFATTLLLLLLVLMLNFGALILRNKLRKRFSSLTG